MLLSGCENQLSFEPSQSTRLGYGSGNCAAVLPANVFTNIERLRESPVHMILRISQVLS